MTKIPLKISKMTNIRLILKDEKDTPKASKITKIGVQGVFCSFVMFREYFNHFLVLGGILVIFQVYGVFLSTYRFKGHFCHFIGFGVFWSFFKFRGYFGHFKVYGLFWSYIGFRGTLIIFQVLGGISVNFQAFRVLRSFFRF